jgi:hypothetical protein
LFDGRKGAATLLIERKHTIDELGRNAPPHRCAPHEFRVAAQDLQIQHVRAPLPGCRTVSYRTR